jgi:hypothetical protein
LLAEPRRYAGRRVATIVSGANIATSLRARLLESRSCDAPSLPLQTGNDR